MCMKQVLGEEGGGVGGENIQSEDWDLVYQTLSANRSSTMFDMSVAWATCSSCHLYYARYSLFIPIRYSDERNLPFFLTNTVSVAVPTEIINDFLVNWCWTRRIKAVDLLLTCYTNCIVYICFDVLIIFNELQVNWAKGISIQFFKGHTDIFQSPLKCFFPCPIVIKFSSLIGYGLKFVKMQF